MAEDFEKAVTAAIADGSVAGGAAMVVDENGKTLFSKAFGKTSLDNDAKDFTFDTTMWIASCSKLSTSIAALQCVEKGLLKLDEPIGNILPEWKNPQIVTAIGDDGKPILKPATKDLTLRRMLTHSSGMSYPGINPLITKLHGVYEYNTSVYKDYFTPLVYEPGEGWEYSPSIDWTGKVVEKVTGQTLEEYMAQHIWRPLGMNSTTFSPLNNAEVMSRMTGRVSRNTDGKLVKDVSKMWLVQNAEDDHGGNGLYSCARDYIKVVTSILMDDGKLLGPEMMGELFRGQLETRTGFEAGANHSTFGQFFTPGYPRGEETEWDYALGGAIVAKDIPGHAAKGTLFWSGLPNSYWFIDRTNGVCGFYGGWLLPPGDARTGQMFAALQKAAVKEAARL